MWNTWPCRNCGSSPPRPHRYGRHTSWNSPLAKEAGQHGALGGQNLKTPADLVGAVLLPGRRGIRFVGSPGLSIRGRLRHSALRSCRKIGVLAQTGLNLVNDAHVAEKLRAAGVDQMRLAVGVTIDGGRGKIRQLRLPPGESGSR